MTQVNLFAGIYVDKGPDIRVSYPINMVPVGTDSGVSAGYLRPADGLVSQGEGPGISRGGIEWRGTLYRVMGDQFVSINNTGVITTIATVPGTDNVTFAYGFDYLAVAADNKLYLYDGTAFTQVTDPDLGNVLDVCWIDGYFLTTDGEFLVVTELNDPFSVNPIKYGSSEINPDPIVGIQVVRNEVYALNRFTVEVFDNVGGEGFPFQRIEGAHITKGCVGTHASCIVNDTVVFVGSGMNESPAVYVGRNAQFQKISTIEVDRILASYPEVELANIYVETRNDNGHRHVYIHLTDRTLVFDEVASSKLEMPIWFVLMSALTTDTAAYRGRHFVWAYNKWQAADPLSQQYGTLSQEVSTHWGERVRWEVSTPLIYNSSTGVQIHELELITLTGRQAFGATPTVSTQYSIDGLTWSTEQFISSGQSGQFNRRLRWMRQGIMRQWRTQRFRGTSDAHLSILRLEARFEPMRN